MWQCHLWKRGNFTLVTAVLTARLLIWTFAYRYRHFPSQNWLHIDVVSEQNVSTCGKGTCCQRYTLLCFFSNFSPQWRTSLEVTHLYVSYGAPVKLHVRARFFRFARKFNSDLCITAPYVQVRTKRRLRCPDQPDPRHHPNPNPNRNPNPNPNPNPDPTLWGALGLLSRSAGVVPSLRAILKTLHVYVQLYASWFRSYGSGMDGVSVSSIDYWEHHNHLGHPPAVGHNKSSIGRQRT